MTMPDVRKCLISNSRVKNIRAPSKELGSNKETIHCYTLLPEKKFALCETPLVEFSVFPLNLMETKKALAPVDLAPSTPLLTKSKIGELLQLSQLHTYPVRA